MALVVEIAASTTAVKACNACGVVKAVSQFHKSGKEWYRGNCKDCANARLRSRYSDKSDDFKKKHKANKLFSFYKMPKNVAKQMAENRYGNCKICNTVQYLVVDHCHMTDKYRDVICQSCNVMLGTAKDNIRTLQSAINYLIEHGAK